MKNKEARICLHKSRRININSLLRRCETTA